MSETPGVPPPYSHWASYKAVHSGLDKSKLSNYAEFRDELIPVAKDIILNWHSRWAGEERWSSFLNKRQFLHEIEETLVAVQNIRVWLEKLRSVADQPSDITIIDLCCGKGVFTMFLTYLAAYRCSCLHKRNGIETKTCRKCFDSSVFNPIRKCIMVDRMKTCDWNHIKAANEDLYREGYRTSCTEGETNFDEKYLHAKIPIDSWPDCNIHEGEVCNKIQNLPGRIAIVGIHLCRTLSPRAISISNICGHEKVPFLCLAPCCLPRLKSRLPVLIFESELSRRERESIMLRRQRIRNLICVICNKKCHSTKDCPSLPMDPEARRLFLKDYVFCWRCGVIGHERNACESTSGRPKLVYPPCVHIDLERVRSSSSPYDEYCDLLCKSVEVPEGGTCDIYEVPLDPRGFDNHANSLISQRKCTWIVYTKS
mmetsp:Transcript_11599/g.15105  ORF Transcript_11599/g.15105 Transcript_11599/m.15105 type:complete len:426 (+) Transcript_11599:136-1413(+)